MSNKDNIVYYIGQNIEIRLKRYVCQRRSKNLPDGGVKVGHCGGQHKAVTGGIKVVQSAEVLMRV